MDYEQINKHFECMEFLHNLSMTLEIVKILSHDIPSIQYSEDYRNRLHLNHDTFDYTVSFYEVGEIVDDSAKLYNNFCMRNSMNSLRVEVDRCRYGGDERFDFGDIRNEIVDLCNKLIEHYSKLKGA